MPPAKLMITLMFVEKLNTCSTTSCPPIKATHATRHAPAIAHSLPDLRHPYCL